MLKLYVQVRYLLLQNLILEIYNTEHETDFHRHWNLMLKLELLSVVLICDYLTLTLAQEMQILS